MRCPVRSPVSFDTTAPNSSSVWRLPFIQELGLALTNQFHCLGGGIRGCQARR
jgi:hypothetical protein